MEQETFTWNDILYSYLTGNPLIVTISEVTNNGAKASLGDITAFIPRQKLYLAGETNKSINGRKILAKVIKISVFASNIVMYRYENSLLEDVDTSYYTRMALVNLYISRGLLKVGGEYEGTVVQEFGLTSVVELYGNIRGILDRGLLPPSSILSLYCKCKVKILDINTETGNIRLGLSNKNNAIVQFYPRDYAMGNGLAECVVTEINSRAIKFTLPKLCMQGWFHRSNIGNSVIINYLSIGESLVLLGSGVDKKNNIMRFDCPNDQFTSKIRTKINKSVGHLFTIPVAAVGERGVVIIFFGRYVEVPLSTFSTPPSPGDYVTIRLLEYDEKHEWISVEEFVEG